MCSPIGRLILIGVGLFVAGSCQKAPEQAAVPPEPATAEPTADPPLTEKQASVKAGKKAVFPPPLPDPPSEEARIRAKANTKGAIACGAVQCVPSREVCVAVSDWHCAAPGAVSDAWAIYACDDGTDCPQGQTCCLSFATALSANVCSKRRGPESDCRVEVCAEGGARCPKGQVCKHSVCMAPDRSATCGAAGRCKNDRPFCRWSERSTRCTSFEEFEAEQSEEQVALLTCTRPSDCGAGARCCTNAIMDGTQCLMDCDTAINVVVCTTDADCTTLGGQPRKGKCAAHTDAKMLPPWLKLCNFD